MSTRTVTVQQHAEPLAEYQQPLEPRLMYRVTTQIYSTYDGDWHPEEVRRPTHNPLDAALISSKLVGADYGKHAPAWDLDLPAVLTVEENGTLTCWVDAPLRPYWFRRFLRLAGRYGLTHDGATGGPVHQDLSLEARTTLYEAHSERMLDTRMRDEILRRAEAPLGTSVEEAIFNAGGAGGRPHRERYIRAPRMRNPWPLALQVPALLIPSTRNHHLYLQARLTWPDYRRLLRAARRAGLLERGYVAMSIQRGATHLRAPWVSKKDS